ncbi:MAG: transglutaminase domain-containing protein [Provencibacterium sp.]|jgi:transglutaminase-like putative cysteine protease|nr:transglutaminase domain-containing protein [Provencibacterium sp.]
MQRPESADFSAVLSSLTGERKRAMEFLSQSLPESDRDSYPPALFLSFCDHALRLRETVEECRRLDEELFFHYVLFPRVNDEDLSDHRALFYRELWPRVAGLGTEEAVLAVNRWCHEQASYQMQDARTASPLTVFRCGSGRCGEESAFLVAALRSVGIAARQVYAPLWAHCEDNHAWVEALCGGRWRFLGACEPEPELDRGWFNSAAARAVLVHSRLFGRGSHPLHGELLPEGPSAGGVCWYNQTARYAAVCPRRFQVNREGRPLPGAQLTLYLLNEAAFRPIARLAAGPDGSACVSLGRGSLWVSARMEGLSAEGLLPAEEETLLLELQPPKAGENKWIPFSFPAPAPGPLPAPLNAAGKQRRKEELQKGEAARRQKLASLFDPIRAEQMPEAADLLKEARGNFDAVFRFLSRDNNPWRERLLRALPVKDLRDADADILEDHLQGALPFADRFPEDVFQHYLLSPRISREPLTAWRSFLAAAPLDPAVSPCKGNYPSLCWPPDCAWKAGRCGRHSRDILTVALLRAHGIPARLRALDGVPELWQNGKFLPLRPERCGTLVLQSPAAPPLLYRRDWSLARWTEEGWQNLEPQARWEKDGCSLRLPAGRYRLLTAVRLPSGDQLAARRELELAAGETAEISLSLPQSSLRDLLYCRALPEIAAADAEGTRYPQAIPAGGSPSILLWLEEGAEPTEHLLHELTAAGPRDERVVLFLRGPDSLRHPALARYRSVHPEAEIRFDDWEYDVEQLARLLACDPERPPLCILCDGQGRAAYAASGYRVGLADLLLHMLGELKASPLAGEEPQPSAQ